jgi:acetolactate synthase-1/2/3 large subunit
MITGGGSMHLNESVRSAGIFYVCNHHEQASAMAAECYARVSGSTGVLSVTTGPGGINALNGVFGAYTDSVPMLVLSGQVKRATCAAIVGPPGVRQLGYQEANVVEMVRGITKYVALVDDPEDIRYHLERAWHLAASGRPGPCWLDIPLDVQAAMVEEQSLSGYEPTEDALEWNPALVEAQCAEVIERLARAERPVILAGTGVRCARAIGEFREAVRLLGVPVMTAQTHDTVATDDPLNCGRPGIFGQRAANFIVQSADALLVLGSSLHIRQISFNWKGFAPGAFKMRVDVDPAELAKPLVPCDVPILCDLKVFLSELVRQLKLKGSTAGLHARWLAWCHQQMGRYPVVQPHQRRPGAALNPYHFYEELFEGLSADDAVICANASAFIMPFQVAKLKDGQRLIGNSGSASMGYDLPAAIGAAFARAGRRVVCLSGEGSIQFNIQELQTIVHHRLPIKIFLLNNGGYRTIRSTQMNFFGHTIGESGQSGVSFPDFARVAGAYGLPYSSITCACDLHQIRGMLAGPGPALCEVVVDPHQSYEPRVTSRELPDGTIVSPGLEDMFPYLSEEEVTENLHLEDGKSRLNRTR